jgi:hypothetical protein
VAKRKTSGKSIQYVLVHAAPVPATREEQDTHLRAFIRQFITPAAQNRWAHCLLESSEKAAGHLHRFERDLDPRYCREMKGPDAFPLSLEAVYGSERGVYFDGKRPPCQMTAAEAATMATEESRDALLSLSPGRRVLFFHHEGTAWKCERP